MTSVTRDSILLRNAGIITITQQKKGARFTLDSLLLADFCRIKPRDRILEPGAGTGIISLLLAKKHPQTRIIAIEILPTISKLCGQNIADNGLSDRITLLEQDLLTLKGTLTPASFDVIVANPPYTKTGTGKQSPSMERSTSRHDKQGSLGDWLGLQQFLKNKGRYFLIFPADRLAELATALRESGLEPKRMRLIHPYKHKPASLVLIEAIKAAGVGLSIVPPLIIHDQDGTYSGEMRAIYGLDERA